MTKWDGAFREIRRRSIRGLQEGLAVESPFAFNPYRDQSDVADFVQANWESLGNELWPVIDLPGRDMNLVRDTLISATKFFHVIECARETIARGAMTWGIVDAYHSCLIGARLIFALYGVLSYGVSGRTVLVDFRPELGSRDDVKRFNKSNKGLAEPIRILRPQPKLLEQSDAWALVARLANVTECPPENRETIASLGTLSSMSISSFRNEMLYDSVAWGWLSDFSAPRIPESVRREHLKETSAAHSLTLKALSEIFGFSRDHLMNLCARIGLDSSKVSPLITVSPDPLELLG